MPFFTEENKFVYCHNISGLLQELGMPVYHPNDWQYTVIQMLTVIQLLLNYLLETVKVSKQIMIQIKTSASTDTATWPDEFVKVYLNNLGGGLKVLVISLHPPPYICSPNVSPLG